MLVIWSKASTPRNICCNADSPKKGSVSCFREFSNVESVAKIYIDTNVFLDFYQSNTDGLEVFGELKKLSDFLVFPEQTINEFKRNRIERLANLVRNIKNINHAPLFTTSVVKSLAEFPEWKKHSEKAKESVKKITAVIEGWIETPSSDEVAAAFDELVRKSTRLNLLEAALKAAKTRKVLGNPPTSPDKHTIGDEIIWETLLAQVTDDLIVVTRDNSFLNNQALLKAEFDNGGGRSLVMVTSHLSEALASLAIGSEKIVAAEKIIDAEIAMSGGSVPDNCPRCLIPLEHL